MSSNREKTISENKSSENSSLKKHKQFIKKLDNYFKISQRQSSIKQEFIGGVVNFLVLSYIMVVIPGLFYEIGTIELWNAIFIATIITTIISTVCMALFVNLPIVLAPGIGLVSYAVQLVAQGTYTFSQMLSICFLAGAMFAVLTITGLRKKIVNAVPTCIKVAIPTGVGLFILNIGLSPSNSGLIDLFNGTATSFAPLIAFFSLIIMIILHIKNIKGGIFIGIISGTILDVILKLCTSINPFEVLWTKSWIPPFKDLMQNTLFQFDFAGLFQGDLFSGFLSVILVVFAVILIDLFDTIGTLYATAEKSNLIDNSGQVYNMNKAMIVDGCGAIISSCFGIPNTTSYVESSAGISSGARTGLSGIFTSLFFFISLFISPIIMIIPIYATAPALILVGLLMFDSVIKIDYKNIATSIPSILTIIIMPLTSNITYGIAVGLISYTLIMIFTGKLKQVNIFTYIITFLFILYFIFQYI